MKRKINDRINSNDYVSERGIISKNNNIVPDKLFKNPNSIKLERNAQKINNTKGIDIPNIDNSKQNPKLKQEHLNKQSQIPNKITNDENKKPAKALHLNHIEKETFFTVLAIGHAFNNFIRTNKLISVESLYGIFYFIKKLSYPLKTRLTKMTKI